MIHALMTRKLTMQTKEAKVAVQLITINSKVINQVHLIFDTTCKKYGKLTNSLITYKKTQNCTLRVIPSKYIFV